MGVEACPFSYVMNEKLNGLPRVGCYIVGWLKGSKI